MVPVSQMVTFVLIWKGYRTALHEPCVPYWSCAYFALWPRASTDAYDLYKRPRNHFRNCASSRARFFWIYRLPHSAHLVPAHNLFRRLWDFSQRVEVLRDHAA